jgi:hypothetical protein
VLTWPGELGQLEVPPTLIARAVEVIERANPCAGQPWSMTMMRVGVLIVLVLSASGAVAREAVYGSHQHPAVRIAQGGGAGHSMGAPAASSATSDKDALSAAPPLIAKTAND